MKQKKVMDVEDLGPKCCLDSPVRYRMLQILSRQPSLFKQGNKCGQHLQWRE
jgi:hypothetical protein